MNRTITITAGDTTRTITTGGDAKLLDGRYAQLDGVATPLVMSRVDINRLFLKARDVFELTLLSTAEADVKNVFVRGGDADFSIERDGEAWQLRAGGALSPADAMAATDLVAKLVSLQAADLRFEQESIGGAALLNLGVGASDGLPPLPRDSSRSRMGSTW